MFVVPQPRMLVERVQFALVEQSVVGRKSALCKDYIVQLSLISQNSINSSLQLFTVYCLKVKNLKSANTWQRYELIISLVFF